MNVFHFSSVVKHFLFENWKITTVTGLALTCVAMFAASFLYEEFKTFRKVMIKDHIKDIKAKKVGYTWRFVHSLFYIFQILLSYTLMLVVMSYNGWIFLSLAIGAGFGYFIFGNETKHVTVLRRHNVDDQNQNEAVEEHNDVVLANTAASTFEDTPL